MTSQSQPLGLAAMSCSCIELVIQARSSIATLSPLGDERNATPRGIAALLPISAVTADQFERSHIEQVAVMAMFSDTRSARRKSRRMME